MSHAEGIHLAPSLRHASDETLISRARAGDSAAREALILRHQSLVRHIAVAFRNAGFSNEDLMQAGTVGLIAAVDRFRPEHGVWFATYAGAVIRGELQHLLRDHGWAVRVPRPLQDLGRAATHEHQRLTQTLGREAAMGEVASALGADETAVSEALTARNAYSAEHLDWHSDDEGEHPRAFAVEDREFDRIENRLVLASVIGRLPHRERRILILRFEHEMTQAVIAEHLQISQMHVSRLLGTALARLRQLLAQAPDTAVARSDPDRPT